MSHSTHDSSGFRRIVYRMETTIFSGRMPRSPVYPWHPVVGEKCPSCWGYGEDRGGPGPWFCHDCNGTGIWPTNHYKKESRVYIEIEKMLGRTIVEVSATCDEVTFKMEDGATIHMYHEQDCCENVTLEDVVGGELTDLVGSPLVVAEKITNESDHDEDRDDESSTWTFYKLGTVKAGVITLRWYGSSNGYYSEGVSLSESKRLAASRKDA